MNSRRSRRPRTKKKWRLAPTIKRHPLIVGLIVNLAAALLWYLFVTLPDIKNRSNAGILRSDWILSFFKPVRPSLAFGQMTMHGAAVENGFGPFDQTIKLAIRWGKLRVSALVRASNGTELAEIRDSQWQVNQNGMFDRNFSGDAIEVRDTSGQVAFHILLCGEAAAVEARWYDGNGNAYAMSSSGNPPFGPIIEHRLAGEPLLTRLGEWFLYPSAQHPGELRVSEAELCRLYTRNKPEGLPAADSTPFATAPPGPYLEVKP